MNVQIAAIVYSSYNRIKFNTSWLETLYEQIIMETVGDHIKPLVVNPGRIMLTSSRLYFQPFNNVEPVSLILVSSGKYQRIIPGKTCAIRQELKDSNYYNALYFSYLTGLSCVGFF